MKGYKLVRRDNMAIPFLSPATAIFFECAVRVGLTLVFVALVFAGSGFLRLDAAASAETLDFIGATVAAEQLQDHGQYPPGELREALAAAELLDRTAPWYARLSVRAINGGKGIEVADHQVPWLACRDLATTGLDVSINGTAVDYEAVDGMGHGKSRCRILGKNLVTWESGDQTKGRQITKERNPKL